MALAPLRVPTDSHTRALDDFAGAFRRERRSGASAVALGWPNVTARRAMEVSAAIVALAFAYGLMRLPVQFSDSLEQLIRSKRCRRGAPRFSRRARRTRHAA